MSDYAVVKKLLDGKRLQRYLRVSGDQEIYKEQKPF